MQEMDGLRPVDQEAARFSKFVAARHQYLPGAEDRLSNELYDLYGRTNHQYVSEVMQSLQRLDPAAYKEIAGARLKQGKAGQDYFEFAPLPPGPVDPIARETRDRPLTGHEQSMVQSLKALGELKDFRNSVFNIDRNHDGKVNKIEILHYATEMRKVGGNEEARALEEFGKAMAPGQTFTQKDLNNKTRQLQEQFIVEAIEKGAFSNEEKHALAEEVLTYLFEYDDDRTVNQFAAAVNGKLKGGKVHLAISKEVEALPSDPNWEFDRDRVLTITDGEKTLDTARIPTRRVR